MSRGFVMPNLLMPISPITIAIALIGVLVLLYYLYKEKGGK